MMLLGMMGLLVLLLAGAEGGGRETMGLCWDMTLFADCWVDWLVWMNWVIRVCLVAAVARLCVGTGLCFGALEAETG